MAELDDIFAEHGVEDMFDHLAGSGEVVTYLDPNVDDVELIAILGDEEADADVVDGDGKSVRHMRTVTISRDPASGYGGVANPGEHASVEIDGETWAIASVESKDTNLATLRCVRQPRTERSRQGYRGQQ